MTTEELLMEVVRMLRERETYYDVEHQNAVERGDYRAASMMLGKSLAYDSARNVMVPDLKSALFSGRVAPRAGKRVEMCFMPREIFDEEKKSYSFADLHFVADLAKHDAIMLSLPKRTMSSLSELRKTALQRCADGSGIALRRVGAPEIRIVGEDGGIEFHIQVLTERMGDPSAPQFKELAGHGGPEIAGKKKRELFYDEDKLKRLVESLGVEYYWESLVDKGVWTKEARDFFVVTIKKGEAAKCQKLLKEVVEKWYTFPVRVIELDAEKER